MKIRLKIRDVIAANGALEQLRLPSATAFRMARSCRWMMHEVNTFENVRLGLVQRYGERRGPQWIVPSDSDGYEEFVEEMDSLLNQEIDVEVETFPLSILPPTLPPTMLMPLWFLFEFEEGNEGVVVDSS